MVTRKRRKFELNQATIRRSVLSDLQRKGGVVHGGKAQNAQLPRKLERKTKDFDIFVNRPIKRAVGLERKLDRLFRGDQFRVKLGSSKVIPVAKVVSNVTDESIVDFARPSRKVETKVVTGVRVATLRDQKGQALRNLRNPETKFRRDKDLNLLNRIKKFEKIRGRKL